ncbi:DMT family transporter [Pseudochrobactrum sp. HB0163]|uniref:DMT family transporter n=1 Tax=Pseudochrobactrum sp. HB0163 TaxID=3450708 RepID=UPI003F6DD545
MNQTISAPASPQTDDLLQTDRKTQKKAILALLLGALLISCSPVLVRFAETGPIVTAFWRLALAIIPMLLINNRLRNGVDHVRPRSLGDIAILAVPGILIGVELVVWHISLTMTSVANSTLIVNLSPIFVALGGWLFLKQKISRVFLSGLAMAITGVLILKGGPDLSGHSSLKGDAVALSAAVLYAAYILMLGVTRRRFSTSTIMLCTTISATLTILPLALIFETQYFPLTFFGWLIVCALAWMTQAGGQSLITYAIAWLPVAFSSLTLLIQPVVAAILAWILLSEPLSIWQICGGLVVIMGIMQARRG